MTAHARSIAPAVADDCRPTPYYEYDLGLLRSRVEQFRAAFGRCDARLFFATMANDCPEVLSALAALGVGACVNSIAHLTLAQACGFRSAQFTSSNLPPHDLAHIALNHVAINLDSPAQIGAWGLAGGKECGLRINCASLGTGSVPDRMGWPAGKVHEAVETAAACGVRLNGLHLYVGTNFQHHAQVLPAVGALFDLAAGIPGLDYLNIGGGVGVNYAHTGPDFDVAAYGRGVAAFWGALCEKAGRSVSVIIEPGRGLVASCGTFYATVTDVKKLGGGTYVGVDASIAIFPRPFHHPDSPHAISLARSHAAAVDRTIEARIVGRTTFSRDILGTAELPANIRPGDRLVFHDAGAYSQSMRSRFLGQAEPGVAIVDRAIR